jgi:hypothetical protein
MSLKGRANVNGLTDSKSYLYGHVRDDFIFKVLQTFYLHFTVSLSWIDVGNQQLQPHQQP